MRAITIVPDLKPAGQVRWVVLFDGRAVGWFYTRENARLFIEQELKPRLWGMA